MAMTSMSVAQDAGASAWGQLQRQQAEQAAEQAQQRARSLQTQAQQADAVAQQAEGNARSLRVKASVADSEARNAQLGLVESASSTKVQRSLSNMHQQLTEILSGTSTSAPTSSAQPVLNAQGQTTGALISVVA